MSLQEQRWLYLKMLIYNTWFKISAQSHELYKLTTISHVYLQNHCMKSSNTKHPKERYPFPLRVLSLFCLHRSFLALSSNTPCQFYDGYLALFPCYYSINLRRNIIIQSFQKFTCHQHDMKTINTNSIVYNKIVLGCWWVPQLDNDKIKTRPSSI